MSHSVDALEVVDATGFVWYEDAATADVGTSESDGYVAVTGASSGCRSGS